MSTRQRTAFCAVIAFLVLSVHLPSSSLAATAEVAWDALWQNRYTEAADAFAGLAADDDATAALQGLLLAELALGRSVEAAATLERYLDGLPRCAADFEVVTFALRNLDLESRDLARDLARGLAKLGREDDLDPLDRRRALALQQHLLMAAGEVGEVEKLARELNRITDWGVLGPFDNTSGSGHGQQFIRGAAYDPHERFEGKFGQPIRWFRPDLLPRDGSIRPSHHFQQDEYVTSYVRTSVDIPEAGEYLLSLGFSGDVQVFVNDRELAVADSEIGGAERLHWRVTLPRGWNRLAFKVSHRDEGDGLAVSLSNLDGSEIDDLEVSVEKNGMAVMREVVAEPVTSARDRSVAEQAAAQPGDPLAALWHLILARRTLAPDALLEHCDELADRFPENGLVRLAVADARQQAGARARYQQQLTELTELAPELAKPHWYLGFEDLKKKYNSRALERAKRVLEHAPNSAMALRLKLRSYHQDSRWQDLHNGALNASRRLPDESFPRFALADWAREMGDRKQAAEYREAAVERMSPSTGNFRRLVASFDDDDFADARDLAEDLTELVPDAASIWTLYVQALIADGDLERASEELEHLLANFPLNVGLLHLQALTILRGVDFDREQFWADNPQLVDALRKNRYLRNEDEVEREWAKARASIDAARERAAADVLATALLVAPGNLRLRDQIRSWRGQKPYREFFPDLADDAIRDLRVEPEAHAGRPAVVLRSINRNYVFDGQASLHDRTLVVQVLDQDGVEDWEVFDLGLRGRSDLTFVEHEIIKPDGGVEQGELFWGKVMFKGLAPGDIVHIRYQLPAIVTGKLAGNIWDQRLFATAEWPTREAVYELVVPDDLELAWRTWNDPEASDGHAPQPREIDVGDDLRGLRWRYRDLPAYAREPGAADPRHYLPWVDVSSLDDWAVVARWFHDLASGQAEPDAEIRRQAAELTEGLADPEAKIAAIFRYVANEVTYESIPLYQSAYIPRRASVVLRDGFGDCKDKSCLMIALARAAGVEDLEFALVTPNAPARPGFMPSPRFNHAIVSRRVGLDRRLWYDPTLRMAEPGQVPRYLVGVPALVASRFDGELVVVDGGAADAWPTSTEARVEVADTGDATVERRVEVAQVDHIVALRRELGGLGEDDLCRRLVRELSTDHPGVEVEARALEGLEPGQERVRLREVFTVPELGQWQGGFLSIGIPWRTQLRDWSGMVVADASRASPINLRTLNVNEEETVEVVLPGGRRLAALPEGRTLSSGDCRYETTFARTDQGLRITRRLVLAGEIVPLASYQAFKEFLDQVRRDMQRPLHLQVS